MENDVLNDVSGRVKHIVMEKLGIEESEITNEASFTDDIGADSLDVFEIMVEMEREFHITIPSEEAEKLTTPGKLINYISQQQK